MQVLQERKPVRSSASALAWTRSKEGGAAIFLERCLKLTPFARQQGGADSGGEFRGGFDQLLTDSNITHLWTYPKRPKMNAHGERFNRTIPAQFVDYHENHLFDDLDLFNQKLADWLVKYNAIRPHKGLELKTPAQAVIENNKKCNMWWTHTKP